MRIEERDLREKSRGKIEKGRDRKSENTTNDR